MPVKLYDPDAQHRPDVGDRVTVGGQQAAVTAVSDLLGSCTVRFGISYGRPVDRIVPWRALGAGAQIVTADDIRARGDVHLLAN